jgi:hypothetical protein
MTDDQDMTLKMKLYLIERCEDWFDQYKSFVVAAHDEAAARQLAYAASFAKAWNDQDRNLFQPGAMPEYPWITEFLDAEKCTWTEIVRPDRPTIIFAQYTGS